MKLYLHRVDIFRNSAAENVIMFVKFNGKLIKEQNKI